MGIDGIGKGGRPPITPDGSSPAGGTSPTSGGKPVDKPFSVDRPASADKAHVAGGVDQTSAASPLARLRAGEIDVNGYMDLKVNEATHGLASSLKPEQLDEIRRALRDQMATDPQMAELVRMSTGHIPKPPED